MFVEVYVSVSCGELAVEIIAVCNHVGCRMNMNVQLMLRYASENVHQIIVAVFEK